MSDTTVVHLLRHGEVDNPHGIIYGRLPGYHLSATGRLMAEAAADFFAERAVVALYCSPLERAQETARPVAERLGLPVVTDDRLIESWNHFEGLKFAVGDGALRNPRNWWYLRNPRKPSWGEPYAHIAARMQAALYRAIVPARASGSRPNRAANSGRLSALAPGNTGGMKRPTALASMIEKASCCGWAAPSRPQMA